MIGGGGDKAGGRLLIGTRVGEVGDRVSLEEWRRLSPALTGPRQKIGRTVRTCAAQVKRALVTTAWRFVRMYATARNSSNVCSA